MKAFTKYSYGGPEILQLEEIEMPAVKEDQIRVAVKANSANPADWRILRGKPFFARFSFGLFKPTNKVPGIDFAGIVEQTGSKVSTFKVGDRVFGEVLEGGAFAEYVSVSETVCGHMPEGVKFSDMACVALAGITALQAISTHGNLKEGEKVLINGSSGGVGHFAVQLAKAHGAEVTAVCSSNNLDFVKSLGADHAIAYDQTPISSHQGSYDLIIDTHGNLSHNDFKRLGKRGVLLGFTTIKNMASVLLKNSFSTFPLRQFTGEANTKDLTILANLMREEKIKVHIDTTYPYTKIPEAISQIEGMRTRGKVAMLW